MDTVRASSVNMNRKLAAVRSSFLIATSGEQQVVTKISVGVGYANGDEFG